MEKDLSELAEMFSYRENWSKPKVLHSILCEIQNLLVKMSSKFVDIDTSFAEVDSEEFRNAIQRFGDGNFSQDLVEIYEALNVYLIVGQKYGEAAAWNLKDQFDRQLSQKLLNSVEKLSLST